MSDSYIVEIEIRADGKHAIRAVEDVSKKMAGIETDARRGVGGAGREVDVLGGKLDDLKSTVGLVAGAFGVQIGVNAIRDVVNLGREVEFAERRFEALVGGPERVGDALDDMKEKTGGVVSEFSLMETATSAIMTGIADNAAEAGELISLGLSLGGQAGVEKLFQALRNQSYLVLDTVGISASDVRTLADQYRDAGMESADAFNRAVVEVGQATRLALGDAADAGITELSRLETWWDDFADRFAANAGKLAEAAATSVNDAIENVQQQQALNAEVDVRTAAILPGLESGMANELNPQFLEEYVSSILRDMASNPEIANQAQLSGEQVAAYIQRGMSSGMQITEGGFFADSGMLTQYLGSVADEVFRQNQNIVGARNIVAANQAQMRAGLQEIARAWLDVQTFMNNVPGGLQRGAQMTMQDRFMSSRQDAYALYAELQGLATSSDGFIGDQGLFSPESMQQAQVLVGDLERFYETFKDNDLISESDLEMARQWADQGRDWLKYIEDGVEAVSTMTMPDLFGQGDNNPLLTGLGGTFLTRMQGSLEDTDFQNLQDALGLMTGAETTDSLAWRDEGLAALEQIYYQFGQDAALTALTSYEEGARAARAGGQPIGDPLALMNYINVGAGTGGYTVRPDDGHWAVAQGLGMSVNDLYAQGILQPDQVIHAGEQYGGANLQYRQATSGWMPPGMSGGGDVTSALPDLSGVEQSMSNMATDSMTYSEALKFTSGYWETIAGLSPGIAGDVESMAGDATTIKDDIDEAYKTFEEMSETEYEINLKFNIQAERIIKDWIRAEVVTINRGTGGTSPGTDPRRTRGPI
jgi:hypothetical protein